MSSQANLFSDSIMSWGFLYDNFPLHGCYISFYDVIQGKKFQILFSSSYQSMISTVDFIIAS